ncbi:30S ribosomal protein S20 [Candidatus Karelsulcia muelleri]|nr:30S ribosomal protein S20 [Candidatus Karelsulcia muelleri]WDI79610.1 30S ribosomal protein S20 [Candidatus Karelsulcia muelleri]WDR78932.1 30S ribosomal protein S20 [Candidatus Karelsulcia muelleri]
MVSQKFEKRKNYKITKTNKYFLKSTKTAMKKNKSVKDKKLAQQKYRFTSSLIDKLAKKKLIHKNKANRLKRKLQNDINLLES